MSVSGEEAVGKIQPSLSDQSADSRAHAGPGSVLGAPRPLGEGGCGRAGEVAQNGSHTWHPRRQLKVLRNRGVPSSADSWGPRRSGPGGGGAGGEEGLGSRVCSPVRFEVASV